jgi:hypothetical protein
MKKGLGLLLEETPNLGLELGETRRLLRMLLLVMLLHDGSPLWIAKE